MKSYRDAERAVRKHLGPLLKTQANQLLYGDIVYYKELLGIVEWVNAVGIWASWAKIHEYEGVFQALHDIKGRHRDLNARKLRASEHRVGATYIVPRYEGPLYLATKKFDWLDIWLSGINPLQKADR